MKENVRRIAIIGTGLVGSTCAYALVNQEVCDELYLIDLNYSKAEGEAWDISQSNAFMPKRTKVIASDYSVCKDLDIIIFTASGPPPKQEQTRLDMLDTGINIADEVVTKVMKNGFNGIFIVVSNPVDIVTYFIYKKSGLPSNQVIGTGTSIDTARLKFFLSDICDNIDFRSIDGFCIGEHGDSQIIVWSTVRIGGVPYLSLRNSNPECYAQINLEEIHTKVIRAGWEIYDRKGTTYYGIGAAVVDIIKAIFYDERRVLPISAFLDNTYGEKDIYTGVPVILGKKGIEKVIELELTIDEKEKFQASNKVIREYIAKIKK
ncbi:MAG: L-lactate dehydrogenase [Chitinophagaceae bacterium]